MSKTKKFDTLLYILPFHLFQSTLLVHTNFSPLLPPATTTLGTLVLSYSKHDAHSEDGTNSLHVANANVVCIEFPFVDPLQ